MKSTNDIRYFLSKLLLKLYGAFDRYAFVEFGSAEVCKAARGRLATTQYKGKELIVDFVGEVFSPDIPLLPRWSPFGDFGPQKLILVPIFLSKSPFHA